MSARPNADEKSLAVLSRQFGHLPDTGWRPNKATPLEAWEGLVTEDDIIYPTRCLAHCMFLCGECFRPCDPVCNRLAGCRRCLNLCIYKTALCFCGIVVPRWPCRKRRRVAALVITERGVVGSLPKKAGPGLRGMKRLVLYGNAIHGPLRSLHNFRNLEALNLSSNRLTGKIPPGLVLLRNLRFLDLHGNALSGNLDDQLRRCGIRTLMRLTHVSLAENLFDGPFPEALLNMSWLVELHLSGLRLDGPLPTCHNLGRIEVLDLSFNVFTGPVPDFGLKGKPKPKVRRGERKPPPLPKEVNVKTERMLRNAEVEKAGGKAGRLVTGAGQEDQAIVVDLKNASTLSIVIQQPGRKPAPKASGPSSARPGSPLQRAAAMIPGTSLVRRKTLYGNLVQEEEASLNSQEKDSARQLDRRAAPSTAGGEGSEEEEEEEGEEAKIERLKREYEEKKASEAAEQERRRIEAIEGEKRLIAEAQAAEERRLVEEKREAEETLQRYADPPPCGKLRELRLTRNRLTGAVPMGYGKLTNLVRLDLGSNKLTGLGTGSSALPGVGDLEWHKLTRLRHLDVSRNKIRGPIPPGIVALEGLHVLRLETNKLTGKIPDVVSRLQNLELLDLSGNDGIFLRDESAKWLRRTLKKTTLAKI